MELWNDGPPEADQKGISNFNFMVFSAGGETISIIISVDKASSRNLADVPGN